MDNREITFSNDELINRIYGRRINCKKPPIERMVSLAANVASTKSFCIEGVQVELEWKEDGRTIQDCVEDFLSKANV